MVIGRNESIHQHVKGKAPFDRPSSKELDKAVHAGREQLVSDFYNAVTQLGFEMSKTTVGFLANEGCKQFFQFIDYKHTHNVKLNNIEAFSKDIIEDFLIWIRNKPAKTETGKMSMLAARRYYSSVKSGAVPVTCWCMIYN